MEIILATRNKGKKRELEDIFQGKAKLLTLDDINFTEEIVEDGNSFFANAMIKCQTIFNISNKPVLADDSGLMVEYLNGEPGIYSARYGDKPNATDHDRLLYLLSRLNNVPFEQRQAAFVSSLILYLSPIKFYAVQETCDGIIATEPKGENGFGYDPVFYLPDYEKTMAELEKSEKNRISHRGKAARKLNLLL